MTLNDKDSAAEILAFLFGAERVYKDHGVWEAQFADGEVRHLITVVAHFFSHAQVGRVLVEAEQRGGEIELSYNPAEGAKVYLDWLEGDKPVIKTAQDSTIELAVNRLR